MTDIVYIFSGKIIQQKSMNICGIAHIIFLLNQLLNDQKYHNFSQ